MPTPNSNWVYLKEAAEVIARGRTVEDARESLIQAAAEGLTIFRAFRLKSWVSIYHSDETDRIADLLANGDPFDETKMPDPRKVEYNVDQRVKLDEGQMDEFLYSTEPGWVLVDCDEKSFAIESETRWNESTFRVRRLDLTTPGPYSESVAPFFIKSEYEYLKIQVDIDDISTLFDVPGVGGGEQIYASATVAGAEPTKSRTGGRKMHKQWPEFVAELAFHLHTNGYPMGSGTDGQEELIKSVLDRLAERGVEGPSRTTVQEAVAAVLRRFRNPDG